MPASIKLLGLLTILVSTACSHKPLTIPLAETIVLNSDFTESTLNYQGLPLKEGQLVFSESANEFSLLFSLLPETYSSHIHAGILIFDQGEPYVYEALGTTPLIFGRVPTDFIKGIVSRRHFKKFIEQEHFVSIYNLPNHVNRSKFVNFARYHYQQKTPFDPYIIFDDHSQLYCTEYVGLALQSASDDAIPLTPYRLNPSLKIVRDWLRFNAKSVIVTDDLLDIDNHVITLSRKLNVTELRLYILIRYELHRRFTENQRLANVFRWSSGHIKLTPTVKSYMEKTMQLFQHAAKPPSWETVYQAVYQEANRSLGFFANNDKTLYRLKLLNYHIPEDKFF